MSTIAAFDTDEPAEVVWPIWLSAQASAPSAAAMMAARTTSSRRGLSWSLGAKTQRRPTETTASGGLIQNTACQPNVSVNQPPRTGPAAVVNAEAAAHTAIARLRHMRGAVVPFENVIRKSICTIPGSNSLFLRQNYLFSCVGNLSESL